MLFENSPHWMLDVAFGEDGSRARRIALMLLKQEKTAKVGVKSRRKKAGWDRNCLLKVLQGDYTNPRNFPLISGPSAAARAARCLGCVSRHGPTGRRWGSS